MAPGHTSCRETSVLTHMLLLQLIALVELPALCSELRSAPSRQLLL